MARPPGLLPYGCAGGLRGFPTAPPCAGGKLARIHAGHPADFPPPARRAIGAPGRAACSRRAEATAGAKRSAASSPHFRFWRARCAPALVGPLGGGEAGTSRPRSGRGQGWTRLFARAGGPLEKPGTDSRTRRAGCPESANRGVVSSWLLLLWTSKGEVTRAPKGRSKLLFRYDEKQVESSSPQARPHPGGESAEACRNSGRALR